MATFDPILQWPQSALVALVRLFLHCMFSNVSSNRWLQTNLNGSSNCPPERGGKVTLLALLFSVVYFQMFLQIACLRWRIVALVAFVWLFPVCIFEWVLKLLAWEEAESHWFKLSPNWLHLFDFFDISSCFLQNFYICINILKSSFHCQCVFCFAQMIGSNWIKKHDWLLNSNNPNFS